MTEQPGRPKYYRGAVAISGDRIALVSDSPQRIERYEREREKDCRWRTAPDGS